MRKNARLLWDAARNFEKDDGYAMASHIALAGLTAIFPFLIFVTSLAGLFGAQRLADEAASAFFEIWPPRVAAPILREIHNVLNNRHGGLLTISAVLAIYFSSSGVEALRTGLNRAYNAAETRPWWRLRIQSIGYVFVGAMALLAMAFLLILGPTLWAAALSQAPALSAFSGKVAIARYGIATIILLAALIIAHRVLPNVKLSLRQTAPGVILTFCAWMIFALAFGSYLSRFALNYVATYAGLASVMIAIVFLYSLAAIFIFGAELNAAIKRQRAALPRLPTTSKGSRRLGGAAREIFGTAEIFDVAPLDLADRHDDEDVGDPELPVDDRALAESGADAHITLDERGERGEGAFGLDLLFPEAIHRHETLRQRADEPFRRGLGVMEKEAQLRRELFLVGPFKTRATDHRIDAMMFDIGPDPPPQHFYGLLAAIIGENAGSAEFEEA